MSKLLSGHGLSKVYRVAQKYKDIMFGSAEEVQSMLPHDNVY